MPLFGKRNVIRKNSTGSEYISRRENLIEGSGISLTVAGDTTDGETDITIATTTPTAPTAPTIGTVTAATTGTPGTPSISVGSPSVNSLQVTWTDVSNEEYYQVQRNTSDSFASQTSPTPVQVSKNSESYTATGLTQNTTYYFKVHGANNYFNVTIPWTDNSSNETGFEVQRATASDYSNAVTIATPVADATTYTDSNLQVLSSATIYYRVRSTNEVGQSAWSSSSVAITSPTRGSSSSSANSTTLAPPTAPSSVTLSASAATPADPSSLSVGSATANSLTATWTDNSTNETKFELQYDTASDLSSPDATIIAAANATSKVVTGLAANTTYYFRVRAVNTTYSMTVGWTDNSNNETGFEIFRNTTNTQPANALVTVGPDTVSYIDTGLNASTTYYYWVRAVNAVGASSSATNSTTTGSGANSAYTSIDDEPTVAPPTAPTIGTATASTTGTPGTPTISVGTPTSSSLTVTWTDISNETSYELQRALDSGFSSGLVTIPLQAGTTSYVSGGLSAATTYYFRLRGVNNVSNVALTWTDNSNNETGFTIQRATDSGFTANVTTIAVNSAGATSYNDLNRLSGTYYYRVAAVGVAGSSSYSSSTSVVVSDTNGSYSTTDSEPTSASSAYPPVTFQLVSANVILSTLSTYSGGNTLTSSYIEFNTFNSGGVYNRISLTGKFRQRNSGGTAKFQVRLDGSPVTGLNFADITTTTVSPNWETKTISPVAWVLPTTREAIQIKGMNTTSGKYAEITDVQVTFTAV